MRKNKRCSIALDADGCAEQDVLMRVGKQACPVVTTEDLNLVAVAAAAEQVTAVGSDIKHAGMGGRGLVADASEQPRLAVNTEDGYALRFQTIAGVEKAAIGAQMDIRTASRPNAVRNNLLQLF